MHIRNYTHKKNASRLFLEQIRNLHHVARSWPSAFAHMFSQIDFSNHIGQFEISLGTIVGQLGPTWPNIAPRRLTNSFAAKVAAQFGPSWPMLADVGPLLDSISGPI